MALGAAGSYLKNSRGTSVKMKLKLEQIKEEKKFQVKLLKPAYLSSFKIR